MTATIIDGRAVAARVRAEVAIDVAALTEQLGRPPGLATILVGDDPASAIYVANKRKACAEAGIADHHRHLAADATREEVCALIDGCNRDPAVSGILLQLPLPAALDSAALTGLIAPGKDVDGLTPISAGRLSQGTPGLRPCTPLGVIELLDAVVTVVSVWKMNTEFGSPAPSSTSGPFNTSGALTRPSYTPGPSVRLVRSPVGRVVSTDRAEAS